MPRSEVAGEKKLSRGTLITVQEFTETGVVFLHCVYVKLGAWIRFHHGEKVRIPRNIETEM